VVSATLITYKSDIDLIGDMSRAAAAHKNDDDFAQPGTLYRQVMMPTDRDHLAANIVSHLSQGVERFIQERAVKDYWAKVDSDLGTRVAHELGLLTPAR
jgi:catalase